MKKDNSDDWLKRNLWRKCSQIIFCARIRYNVSRIRFYMTSSIKSSLKISVSNHLNSKNLIYHVNRSTEEKRFCILFNCVLNILIIAHEREQDHSRFDVCFEIIIRFWYIKELIKALSQYIKYCSLSRFRVIHSVRWAVSVRINKRD
jgi:hypothetical protein